jgi:hypothetical protein
MRNIIGGMIVLAALAGGAAKSARAAGSGAPPGYQLVNIRPAGRSFATTKPGVASVPVALRAALRDLTGYFGARPIVRRAYEDTRDHHSGGAAFSVTYSGAAVKGLIFCRLGPRGASIAVVAARVEVSAAEWRRLMAGPANAPSSGAAPAPAEATPQPAASGPLRQVSFSDGTGTIGLAPGWTVDLKTCASGIVVQGPGDQRVVMGTSLPVYLPNSAFARQQRAMGLPIIIGPLIAPADALRMLAPQMSRMAGSNHLAQFVLDNVALKETLPAMFPGGRSAMVTYGTTENGRRGRQHYKNLAQLDLVPPSNEFWMLRFGAELRAPDATFDHDLPLMLKIAKSWHGNDAVMARRTNAQTAAKQRRFDAFQGQQREKSAAFDRYIADQEQASNARIAGTEASTKASNDRLRSANDVDEMIRGVRTVEDTQTGQRTSVDLGDVDKVVDQLNEHDSDRYKQIPLRDEAEGQ